MRVSAKGLFTNKIEIKEILRCSLSEETAQTFLRILEEILVKISFIEHSGAKHEVDVEEGMTVMEGAVKNAIPGVDADCGGSCACATCHVYIDEGWMEKVGKPHSMEEDMLDFAFEVQKNSRLGCQVKVTSDLDGLIVMVPEKQA